jgi:hypothetical protein
MLDTSFDIRSEPKLKPFGPCLQDCKENKQLLTN